MNNSDNNPRRASRDDSQRVSRTPRHSRNSDSAEDLSRSKARELTTKRRGELAELAFAYKATSVGLKVAKPYGDSERYDFVVDNGHRFWRVQVKSTTTLLNGLFHLNSHRRLNGRAVPYHLGEIDFLAAYIFPEDAWFILPVRLIHNRASLLFAPLGYVDPRPHLQRHKQRHLAWQDLQPFREAWTLLAAHQ